MATLSVYWWDSAIACKSSANTQPTRLRLQLSPHCYGHKLLTCCKGGGASNTAAGALPCKLACCSGICDPYDQDGGCTPDELAREWLPRVYSGAASVVLGCAFYAFAHPGSLVMERLSRLQQRPAQGAILCACLLAGRRSIEQR